MVNGFLTNLVLHHRKCVNMYVCMHVCMYVCMCCRIRLQVMVFPRKGRHIIFRGNLNHGVPSLEYMDDEGERWTFLINWWDQRPIEPYCRNFHIEPNSNVRERFTVSSLNPSSTRSSVISTHHTHSAHSRATNNCVLASFCVHRSQRCCRPTNAN